jgi:heavy metal sensor kinase
VNRWWRSHTVRVRLTLWYLGAMLVVLGVYVIAVYVVVRQNAQAALDQQLRGDFQWAAATVDYTPDEGFSWIEPEVVVGDEAPWVQVWSEDGAILLVSSAEARRTSVRDSQRLAMQADDRIVSADAEDVSVRILTRRGRIGDVAIVIQVARPETAMEQQLRDLLLIFVFGLPLALAVAGLGGYTLASRALAPVERMTERARSISAEHLSERLPVHNPDDEMGRLATVFNETLARLERSFEQMRRFTTDVSHELRTPLTAIRSVGEVGLRGHRDEAAFRGIIGSMLEEVDRLSSLVDRLLTLSRAESGQAVLAREPVSLDELAENVVSHLGVLAEEKGQTLVIDREPMPVHALADRLVLRQALINLVDNAIKFSPEGGAVRVRVGRAGAEALIEVVDSGVGIDPEVRDRVFDRFYRADGVEATGTGLGLSIAKGAVEAGGGRLTLEQSGPSGSTFRISMPLANG